VIETDWGRLTWYVSAELGNSNALTVGECRIRPGCENPRHSHPNCEEALVVQQGQIRHSINDQSVVLDVGDAITVPGGVLHNAVNIGDTEAVLSIAFSSGDRRTVGE
jgi:quercetin dioxygenase-like cupin family protein